jgi:hypothetical protein
MLDNTHAPEKSRVVPGYRQLHGTVDAPKYLAEGSSRLENRQPLSFAAFMKDAFYYSLMVDLFAKTGIRLKARRALDLGGAEGTIARLMKSDGVADWVQVSELYNMDRLLPDDLYRRHLRKWRVYSMMRRWGLPSEGRAVRPWLFDGLDYWPNKSDKFFNIANRGPGTIDRYSLRDFYSLTGPFDLLTVFSVIDYLDPQAFFEKAGKLVEPGGHLFALLAYWWYPVNCSLVVGAAPYASQRMTRDAFVRHLEQHCPDEVANTMQLYDYFHQGRAHPTADDYIEMANKHGFELVAMRRLISRGGTVLKRTPLPPHILNQDPEYQLSDVLSEAQGHSPGVRLADLKTNNVLLGFVRRQVKPGSVNKAIAAHPKS